MTSVANAAEAAAASATGLQGCVRPITDGEVTFFEENGWALLRGLVSPEACRALLERGKPKLENMLGGGNRVDARGLDNRKSLMASEGQGQGTVTEVGQWVEWRSAVRDAHDPVFGSIALDKTMGRNMQRLLVRDVPLRIMHDIFTCKLPEGASTASGWHQDNLHFPLDQNVVTVWIALDEIKPEQGPLQFYSGSHRMGLLGRFNVIDAQPALSRLEVSPPHHLQPGDCTVHHGLTVHGAGANGSPDPRWSYLVCYFPGDALYTGAPNHNCDGFGLKPNQKIEHPSFTPVPV